MKPLFSLMAVSLIAAPSVNAQGPTHDKANWIANQRADHDFRLRQFEEAGFVPIEEVEEGRRNVRRLILRDPYMMLPIPGVEFEKRRDGKVMMRIQYREYRTERVEIGAVAWDRIVAGDNKMFAIPEFRPAPKKPPTIVSSVCHDWTALVQATGNRSGSWSGCHDPAAAKRAYVETMLKTALATRPDCEAGEDPRRAFQNCFGETDSLDDIKLNEAYSRLLKEISDAPGAAQLATARLALRAPGLTVGSPAWIEAREAVRKVLELQSFRRAKLQELIELDYHASDASRIDKLKLKRAIRRWHQSITAQDLNHVELLRSLVWAGERSGGS